MNKIVIYFTPCTPAPSKGYNIIYRVEGSGGSYINAGNFFISPAIFYDSVNPAGTCYEGFIKSDCSTLDGNMIPWSSCESESGGPLTTIPGTIANSARGVFVDLGSTIPCDITFPIDGFYDDFGTPTEFTTNITVLANETSGQDLTAVPGHGVITCIRPTTAGTTTFIYSTSCLGISYTFILEIDNPC